MKSKALIVVSLAANVLLLLGVAFLAARGKGKANPQASPAVADSKPAAVTAPMDLADLPPGAEASAATNSATFDWTRVESADYREYIANLRAIGCPEETIRDIIVADVNKLFASRTKAENSTNRFEYWKGGNPLANLFNEEKIARQQETAREKRELLRTLLGTDAPQQPSLAAAGQELYEAMLDFVPAEKQTQLMELEQKFAGKLMGSLKKASQGDTAAMREIQAEKDKALLDILSPDEKLQYDLRMSQTAMLMRMQMGDLELSEPQFQEIFKLRKQIDDEFGIEGMAALNKADQDKRDAARKSMNEQVKAIMGDRYPEYKYELGGDWAAQVMKRVANENKLPRESALQAFTMTDLARAQADAINADAAQSEAAKQAALQRIYDETSRSISQVLGEAPAKSYLGKVTLIPGFKPGA